MTVNVFHAFREHRPFPGQDPWIVAHGGALLLVQAAEGNHSIVVKRFANLERIDRNTETLIWEPAGPAHHLRDIWAPELHHLGGRWYVYFSARDAAPESRRCYALVADDPLGPYRLIGPVGEPTHDSWATDLTVVAHEGRLYAVWSGWEEPEDDFPQNLYLAPMADPWTIRSGRRCLSRPEHGWEMSVAPVNEGPEAIRHPATGRLFLCYSADASWTDAYKTGLLEWTGGDIADAASWRKLPRPWFTGGGHGSVVETPAGARFVYHRKITHEPGWADREICWAPFGWNAEGYPVVRRSGPPEIGIGRMAGPGRAA